MASSSLQAIPTYGETACWYMTAIAELLVILKSVSSHTSLQFIFSTLLSYLQFSSFKTRFSSSAKLVHQMCSKNPQHTPAACSTLYLQWINWSTKLLHISYAPTRGITFYKMPMYVTSTTFVPVVAVKTFTLQQTNITLTPFHLSLEVTNCSPPWAETV